MIKIFHGTLNRLPQPRNCQTHVLCFLEISLPWLCTRPIHWQNTTTFSWVPTSPVPTSPIWGLRTLEKRIECPCANYPRECVYMQKKDWLAWLEHEETCLVCQYFIFNHKLNDKSARKTLRQTLFTVLVKHLEALK